MVDGWVRTTGEMNEEIDSSGTVWYLESQVEEGQVGPARRGVQQHRHVLHTHACTHTQHIRATHKDVVLQDKKRYERGSVRGFKRYDSAEAELAFLEPLRRKAAPTLHVACRRQSSFWPRHWKKTLS